MTVSMTVSGELRGRAPASRVRCAPSWIQMLLLLAFAAASTVSAQAKDDSTKASSGALDVASRSLVIPTAAHLVGLNGTNWRTDLQLSNPGSEPAALDVTLLPRDQDNSSPANTMHLTVPPGQSARYSDLLSLFGFTGAAAVRIDTSSGSLLVTSRTYNQRAKGSFGAIIAPAVAIAQGRLIGLSHDPTLTTGSRTNIGLVNATAIAVQVLVELHNGDGSLLGTSTHHLDPFEYVQLDRVFETVSQDLIADGFAIVSSDTPGASFFAYASVVDNVTGDGDYAPVLAAVAPIPEGLSGTWYGTFLPQGTGQHSEQAEVVITIKGQTVAGVVKAFNNCGPDNGVIAGTLDSAETFHGIMSQGGSSGKVSGVLQEGPALQLISVDMVGGSQAFCGGEWDLHRQPWDY
jgi:hypothetical protein